MSSLLSALRFWHFFLFSKPIGSSSTNILFVWVKVTVNWNIITWWQSVCLFPLFTTILSDLFVSSPGTIIDIRHFISVIILLDRLALLRLISLSSPSKGSFDFLLHSSCLPYRPRIANNCTVVFDDIDTSSSLIRSNIFWWLFNANIWFLWVTFANMLVFKVLIACTIIQTIIRIDVRINHSKICSGNLLLVIITSSCIPIRSVSSSSSNSLRVDCSSCWLIVLNNIHTFLRSLSIYILSRPSLFFVIFKFF